MLQDRDDQVDCELRVPKVSAVLSLPSLRPGTRQQGSPPQNLARYHNALSNRADFLKRRGSIRRVTWLRLPSRGRMYNVNDKLVLPIVRDIDMLFSFESLIASTGFHLDL